MQQLRLREGMWFAPERCSGQCVLDEALQPVDRQFGLDDENQLDNGQLVAQSLDLRLRCLHMGILHVPTIHSSPNSLPMPHETNEEADKNELLLLNQHHQNERCGSIEANSEGF